MAILLASTSGWLNGLMPITAPATATAISKRKNSWPKCILSGTTDAHHRLAGGFQRVDLGALDHGGAIGEFDVDKQAIFSIDLGRADRFVVDRYDAVALFAGGFREQLLEPGADIDDAGRGDEGDLVAALLGEHAHGEARVGRRD